MQHVEACIVTLCCMSPVAAVPPPQIQSFVRCGRPCWGYLSCWRGWGVLGLRRLWLEGGGVECSREFVKRIIAMVLPMVCPVLIGSGQPGHGLEQVRRLADARRPAVEVTLLGEGGVLFDCDLSRA